MHEFGEFIASLLSQVLHDLCHHDRLIKGYDGALQEALGQALTNVVGFMEQEGRVLVLKFLKMKWLMSLLIVKIILSDTCFASGTSNSKVPSGVVILCAHQKGSCTVMEPLVP
jgi:hypothetical protein